MSNEEKCEGIAYWDIYMKPFSKMSDDEKESYIREKKTLAKCEWDWERIHSWRMQYPSSPIRMFRMWDTFGQTPKPVPFIEKM